MRLAPICSLAAAVLLAFATAPSLIAQAPTTTTLTISPGTTTTQRLTLNAIVSPAPASGYQVTFTVDLPGQQPTTYTGYSGLYGAPASTFAGPLAAGTYIVQAHYAGTAGSGGVAPSTSAPQRLTISANGIAAFKGQYAFLFQGFSSAGVPSIGLGTFTADGKGTITGGQAELIDSSTSNGAVRETVSGSYLLDANGNGSLTLSVGGIAQTLQLTAPNVGSAGLITNASATPHDGALAGRVEIARQTPAYFFEPTLAGDFRVSLLGAVTGSQAGTVAASGLLHFSGDSFNDLSLSLNWTVGTTFTPTIAYSGGDGSPIPDPATGIVEFSVIDPAPANPPNGVFSFILVEGVIIDQTHLFLMTGRTTATFEGPPTPYEVFSGTAVQ